MPNRNTRGSSDIVAALRPQAEAAGDALLEHHATMIAASAMSPKVAVARGYRSIVKVWRLEEFGFTTSQRRVPGLLVPRHNVHGEPDGWQYRPDDPRSDCNGRPMKYESPNGQRNTGCTLETTTRAAPTPRPQAARSSRRRSCCRTCRTAAR